MLPRMAVGSPCVCFLSVSDPLSDSCLTFALEAWLGLLAFLAEDLELGRVGHTECQCSALVYGKLYSATRMRSGLSQAVGRPNCGGCGGGVVMVFLPTYNLDRWI
jgi:hypothetical protein